MSIPGQPPDSPALQDAMGLLAQGRAAEAEVVVTKAAKQAKRQFGSGSHPLACAYADMARLHYRTGEIKRAAAEFRHAGDSPMPEEPQQRSERLAFMFGFAACLDALGKSEEAEKVLRQCVEFARNLHGVDAPGYAAALEPVAAHLLKAGRGEEAARLTDEAFEILWRHGDACRGDAHRVRRVLADLLAFVDRRFGDDHPALADTLAAIAHYEAALGERGDGKLRSNAARRAVWSFTKSRAPRGLLESIEVVFENDGTIHLIPRLAREPDANESVLLEMVLMQAVDDLYSRPARKQRWF